MVALRGRCSASGARQASLLLLLLPVLFAAAASTAEPPRRERPPPTFPLPPDVRPAGCAAEVVDPSGNNFSDFKVSIIIPYRGEKWEHIKWSLESILYFTPKRYLSEIFMISDGNKPDTLFLNELRQMSNLVNVLVLPPPGVGLIEAKMRAVGGAAVKSNILVFLEPHIRVNRQWLQPLLRRIRLHPQVLAMPVLDPIPQDDFSQYHSGTYGHWRFEWNLNLVFTNPEGKSDAPTAQPYMSPATSGGIFAIRRDWWDKLGFYDHGMMGWGGDHIEATLKVWRCGGHIEIVPCSHVGHLFRAAAARPYMVEVNQVVRNYARIAEVWMEEYLPKFYKVKPEAKAMDKGDMSEAFALKERLECKSMKWYLENVDREMDWEKDKICIPGCQNSQCCTGPAAPGRSTIDRVLQGEAYRRHTKIGIPKSEHHAEL